MTNLISEDNTQSARQLSTEQARAALQFLQRTQLQGAEMPAYVSIFNVLSALAQAAEGEDAVTAA